MDNPEPHFIGTHGGWTTKWQLCQFRTIPASTTTSVRTSKGPFGHPRFCLWTALSPAECQGHSVEQCLFTAPVYLFRLLVPPYPASGAALRRVTRRWRATDQRTILTVMRRNPLLRRVVGILAMAAILLSLPLHAGMAMSASADMEAAGAMLAADEGTMPSCDGCGDTGEIPMMTAAGCVALCGGAFVAVPATVDASELFAPAIHAFPLVSLAAGIAGPPDPYPPRPSSHA